MLHRAGEIELLALRFRPPTPPVRRERPQRMLIDRTPLSGATFASLLTTRASGSLAETFIDPDRFRGAFGQRQKPANPSVGWLADAARNRVRWPYERERRNNCNAQPMNVAVGPSASQVICRHIGPLLWTVAAIVIVINTPRMTAALRRYRAVK